MFSMSYVRHRHWIIEQSMTAQPTPLSPFAPLHILLAKDTSADARLTRAIHGFRALVEYGSDGVALGDAIGNILYCSPAITRILGYSVEEFIGTNFLALLHPDDLAEGCERFAAVLDNRLRPTYQRDLRYRHRDSTWRYLEVVRVNRLDDPAVRAIVANFRDVTERHEALETVEKHGEMRRQIEQARRVSSLGRVAASVAHEFNNVLMGIQPFAEILRQKLGDDSVRQRPLKYILDGLKRGRLICQQILRFASPAEPRLVSLDLGEWTRLFSEEARQVLHDQQLEVDAAGSIAVQADPEQLSQVMLNLITNARDAGAPGAIITIGAASAEGIPFLRQRLAEPHRFAALFVRDHGQGIPPEVLDNIFEPLFTTKKSGGTGLGLAVVQQIISEHGGTILVESEPGSGSTFYIALPIEQAAFECPEGGGENFGM